MVDETLIQVRRPCLVSPGVTHPSRRGPPGRSGWVAESRSPRVISVTGSRTSVGQAGGLGQCRFSRRRGRSPDRWLRWEAEPGRSCWHGCWAWCWHPPALASECWPAVSRRGAAAARGTRASRVEGADAARTRGARVAHPVGTFRRAGAAPMTVQDTTTETQTGPSQVVLTDLAASKVKSLLEQEGRDDLALRIAVQPGGCSGMRYQLFFDERQLD